MNLTKKAFTIGVISLNTLFFFACSEKKEDFDVAHYQKIVEAGNAQIRDAVLKKNADSIIQIYAANATLCPPSEDFIKGKEAIRNWWQAGLDYGLIDLQATPTQITGNSERFYELGKIIITIIAPPGDTTYNELNKYLVVWAKQANGDYKIESEIWNSDREYLEEIIDTAGVQ